MDGQNFDDLTRAASVARSRRGALGLVTMATRLGLLGVAHGPGSGADQR